ncbi:MAG: glutamyl-tRNA reductase [Gammaproteobacteria bacterium]|jgi:glutamyl-tRNA reductase|nr:glutamyl-tRNA reductase [Gammaproteobacteria bacterium]MBT4494174.1 glutamyl-tRNA reductase [Gammaproteobacteria bacterium]MBT7372353.1 glutamyl-tRNA reductase [Gammaproteobacteria bacterium]
MNLLIVGINHTSAPVELREKVAFTPEQLADALQDLAHHAGFSEIAILSTCNRTEVIATTSNPDAEEATSWLANYHGVPLNELKPSIYVKLNRDAATHAVRVACGLDSMVIGEPQILGQVKEAYEYAGRIGTLGSELHHLSQTTFRIAKRVRTETTIGENSISVASTAVTLAEQLFTDLPTCHILLIGAGDTSELVGRHLLSAGISNITIANRTLENARRLASELRGTAIDLQSIPGKLHEADIVIASTAAQLPILGKGTVERALKLRKHKPILMVDLAVPRDIEPEVAELRDIYLYSVDDLQEIINSNLTNRQRAAEEAEGIVKDEVSSYRSRHEAKVVDETLVRFRAHHESIKAEELNKAMARLQKGADPREVLSQLANQLTNKILHTPSINLKGAASDGEDHILEAINQLYRLDHDRE